MLRKDGKFYDNEVYLVEEATLIDGEFHSVQLVSACANRETARLELKKRVNYIHNRHSDLEFNIFGKDGFAEIMFRNGPTYRVYTTVHSILDHTK